MFDVETDIDEGEDQEEVQETSRVRVTFVPTSQGKARRTRNPQKLGAGLKQVLLPGPPIYLRFLFSKTRQHTSVCLKTEVLGIL